MHYWPEAPTCYHYLSIPPRDGGAVSVATTKTTRATGHGAGLTLKFLFFFCFLNRRQVSALFLSVRAHPAFAMIYLVRRLYDPDATSAP